MTDILIEAHKSVEAAKAECKEKDMEPFSEFVAKMDEPPKPKRRRTILGRRDNNDDE